MIKYLGTHNSGTSSKLVWWQRPFGYLLNLTSRCQTLSIEEQLKNNVRLFNLQVTFYNNECVFSHGLCIYTGRLLDAIETMKQYATKESPVYFQLFLDKNFLLGQNKEAFKKLVCYLLDDLRDTNIYMIYAYIEGTGEYPHRNGNIKINTSEHYWTTSWAENSAKSWIDKLPLPKRHAKIYNQQYMDNNKADYLMLDFIEIGKHFIEIGNHFVNAGYKTSTTTFIPTTTTSLTPVYTPGFPPSTTTTWFPTTTTSHVPTTTTTWYPTTTTSVNPIYATVAPVTFKINNVTYNSGAALQIAPGTKITLSCPTGGATIYYSINGGAQCLYNGPISVYNSSVIDAYATKATDYINHIYYGPSSHIVIKLNVMSTTTTWRPTTTTTWRPTTTTTWFPTTTTSYRPTTTTTWFPTTTTSYRPTTTPWPWTTTTWRPTTTTTWRPTTTTTWRPTTTTTWFPTTTTSYRPTTTPWPWTTTTSWLPTTTTTWFPTTTTSPNRLELKIGSQTREFKPGYNFTLNIKKGNSKTISFDAINGYEAPNNMTALSENTSIVLSSLSIFYRNITLSGVNVGKTKIYIATTYRDMYCEGYIIVNVIEDATTTTTWLPTTTTTIIYDGNSPAGNGNPRPTTTTSRKPVTTTTTWFPTTTTWMPTTTTTKWYSKLLKW